MIKAEYIDHMGDDLTVVNAARVSFDKESEWDFDCATEDCICHTNNCESCKTLSKADKGLIKYLADHNHFTPFTHPQVTLRVTAPIFIARQQFKHTVGFTYNEVSRRYVDSEPEFYIPDEWRARPNGSVKQGSGGKADYSNHWKHSYNLHIADCKAVYQSMLDTGIAPEQARMVLPQSMLTSYYVTGSLSAWARMVKQRKDPHSQKEIQELAKCIETIIAPLYPESWEALMGE